MCTLPALPGDCVEQVAMYTYDSVSSKCVRFMYSGCGGNANRYETRAMCEVACERYMIGYDQTTPSPNYSGNAYITLPAYIMCTLCDMM